jgi:hypothetical protein
MTTATAATTPPHADFIREVEFLETAAGYLAAVFKDKPVAIPPEDLEKCLRWVRSLNERFVGHVDYLVTVWGKPTADDEGEVF